MTEAPAEQPIRLGPAAANVARSIWHQKELLVLGLVLGLALGWLALPKVLSGGSTYDATIRMRVVQSPTDAVLEDAPLFGPAAGSDAPGGASPEVLKDILIADSALKQLSKSRTVEVPDDLTPILLLNRLSITPLEGTSYVDLAFSDGDPALAAAVVEQYAKQFAASRNRFEERRLDQLIRDLENLASQEDSVPRAGDALPSAGVR